jgi:hypothetical protein
MSHFTKLDKANIIDKDAFVKACKDLGITKVAHNVEIKDFYGKKIKVDVAVTVGNYSIGLQKRADGKYDMVADWWGIRGELRGYKTDEELQDMILKHTTKNTIISKYSKMGYRANVTEDEEQNVQVELVKY